MDATQPQQPSPQSVGREFVRQYYTLLNKAPNQLHRFYNNNSSFIHGESSLVVGQKNIHNRILQLNFHDCHAKISQVDAQATLGNGVVVQVTGELSNDGQPMRRFTQTFVLAAQSPKKYYVHNDIFRYQDLYTDEENDGESRSENDEELNEQQTVSSNDQSPTQVVNASVELQPQAQQQLPAQVVATTPSGIISQQAAAPQQQQQTAIYYSLSATAGGRPVQVLAAPPRATAVPLTAQYAAAPPPQVPTTPSTANQMNGVVTHDDLLNAANVLPPQQQQSLVSQNTSPPSVVAPVPIAVTTVMAQQTGNTSAIPQTTPSNAGNFQQSPIVPQPQQLLVAQKSHQHVSTGLMMQTQTVVEEDVDISTTGTATTTSETNLATPAAVPSVAESTTAPMVDDFKTINEQQQQEKYEASKHQQNEPKTYANLFKSSSSPSGFVNAAMQQQQQIQQQASTNSSNFQSTPTTISTTTFSQSNTVTSSSSSVYNNRNDNSLMRMDNNQIQSGSMPQRMNSTRINKDFDRRTSTTQQFGDNQQLFFGNVPHIATEEELKALFSRFGTVIELRIHSKSGNKLPPGVRYPLNYGFVTYEDPESVQNCLSNCPLYFPESGPDMQKLNVEEKKPRMRSNDMPQRQPMGNMNNNMSNSQRGNMGGSGPSSRSLSNSGGMMRNSNTGGNMQRGSSGGPRMGGGGNFNRNDNRGPPQTGGPQSRGGSGISNNSSQTGGGSYGRR